MRRVSSLLLLSLAVLAGCVPQTAQPAAKAQAQAASEEAAIASAISAIDAKKGDYLISPADLLTITIYENKDLNREVRVSQNGTISFPLVGVVSVGGLSVIDAEKALSDKLKDYLVAPQVTIFIKEYGNKKVFVFGQVTKPGSYDLPTESKLTVLEAVSMAGGFTPIAAPDRTRVIRNVNGKSKTFVVEVSAITKRGEKDKDLSLEPNDVIFVPQSYF